MDSKGVWCGGFLSFILEAGDSYNWVLFLAVSVFLSTFQHAWCNICMPASILGTVNYLNRKSTLKVISYLVSYLAVFKK